MFPQYRCFYTVYVMTTFYQLGMYISLCHSETYLGFLVQSNIHYINYPGQLSQFFFFSLYFVFTKN